MWDNRSVTGQSIDEGRSQPATPEELRSTLEAVATSLERARFVLPLDGRHRRERDRTELIMSIREYLLPRLEDSDAPMVASFLGPGGAGKSLLLNSVARRLLSETGPVRPTTERPLIWAHRSQTARYWQDFMQRVGDKIGRDVESVVGTDELTAELTIVDAPAFDYVSDEGRLVADDVLSLTDLCVFVTTAMRYADADSWDFVRRAQYRGLPILFVLNRLPSPGLEREAVLGDFAERLADAGLLMEPDPSLIFAIDERPVEAAEGMLSAAAVAGLRKEFEQLANRPLSRALVRQATRGAIADLAHRAGPLAEALTVEAETGGRLLDIVEASYQAEGERLGADLAAGHFAYLADAPWEEAAVTLATVAARAAGLAAQSSAAGWEQDPIGRMLLASPGGAELWRVGPSTKAHAEQGMLQWAANLEQLSVSGRQRPPRKRKRKKMATLLRVAALDPARSTPAELVLRYGLERAESLLRWSHPTLLGDLRSALRADASRFAELVGDIEALHGLAAAIEEGIDTVASAAGAMA